MTDHGSDHRSGRGTEREPGHGPGLVPLPRHVTGIPPHGVFVLDEHTAVGAGPGTEGVARWLRATVGAATGLPLPEAGDDAGEHHDSIVLRVSPDVARELGPEGYRLRVEGDGIAIDGGGAAGVFLGAQTLRQLLGPEAFRRAPVTGRREWPVPMTAVEDAPRFRWRGVLLDVARHFTPKDGVLRFLDLLAAHKLNVLHLHLTDDQGWRLEIERYPRLTEVGAWRARTKLGHRASPLWDERPHGGFYTKDDIREIVAYAAERHITVVPEIDVPGHSQAAIAAYPELGNTDVVDTAALSVWDTWGISPNVLAPTDHTLAFYENVLTEVLELFPSVFVHLGGDECPKEQWKASPAARARIEAEGLGDEDGLQSWFIRHFDRWLAARGRRLVGWDEILEGAPAASDEAEGASGGASRAESEPEPGGEPPRDEERRQGAGAPGGGAPGGGAPGAGAPGGGATKWGLAPGATVSSWRGYAGGIAAAEAGHDVVMCPEQWVYLDHRQAAGPDEPVPIGYVRTLEDVYLFEPVPPELTGEAAARVIGAQANLWTEVTETQQRVDYQAFPRLAAFAEAVWSALPAPADRDYAGFERRMTAHYARLDALGVDYRPPGGPRPWQRRPGLLGRPLDGRPPIV